jgi:3-dehydrosphinganine reductase
LRSELLLYSISVHVYFPGTLFTPGYTEENKTKPKITLKIEEGDDGLTPEQAAEGLLRGMSFDTSLVDILTLGFRRAKRTFSYIH